MRRQIATASAWSAVARSVVALDRHEAAELDEAGAPRPERTVVDGGRDRRLVVPDGDVDPSAAPGEVGQDVRGEGPAPLVVERREPLKGALRDCLRASWLGEPAAVHRQGVERGERLTPAVAGGRERRLGLCDEQRAVAARAGVLLLGLREHDLGGRRSDRVFEPFEQLDAAAGVLGDPRQGREPLDVDHRPRQQGFRQVAGRRLPVRGREGVGEPATSLVGVMLRPSTSRGPRPCAARSRGRRWRWRGPSPRAGRRSRRRAGGRRAARCGGARRPPPVRGTRRCGGPPGRRSRPPRRAARRRSRAGSRASGTGPDRRPAATTSDRSTSRTRRVTTSRSSAGSTAGSAGSSVASAQTASAAAIVQPPANTDSRRNSRRSGSASNPKLHSTVARSVCCRGSRDRLTPPGTSDPAARRAASSAGGRACTRAAASSIASGRPSRRRQISAAAGAAPASRTKPRIGQAGPVPRTAPARRPRPGVATGRTCSPVTPSSSRPVASIRTPRAARDSRSASSAQASTRCSQLSSTSSSVLSRRWSASRSAGAGDAVPFGSGSSRSPRLDATASASRAGSRSGASSSSHTPSGTSGASRRAGLDGQARLAHATRPGERDQPVPAQERGHVVEIAVPADECGQPLGQPCGGAADAGVRPGAWIAGSWARTARWSRRRSGDGSMPSSSARTARVSS